MTRINIEMGDLNEWYQERKRRDEEEKRKMRLENERSKPTLDEVIKAGNQKVEKLFLGSTPSSDSGILANMDGSSVTSRGMINLEDIRPKGWDNSRGESVHEMRSKMIARIHGLKPQEIETIYKLLNLK